VKRRGWVSFREKPGEKLASAVMNHTLPKIRFFALHFFVADRQFWSNFNPFDVVGLDATDFGEITQ